MRDGVPRLRLYQWSPPCLSFGRNQPAAGLYDASAAASLGIEIVRRPTGGLAVLHHQELTYAFVAPAALHGGPRATYLAVNHALVRGLQRLGVPASLSEGIKRSAFGSTHPCFAEPAPGEVVAHGRKLVGSAQRCENRTILQHGSILLSGSQDDVARIARVPFQLHGQATTLTEVIGTLPDVTEIAGVIATAFEQLGGTRLAPTDRFGNVAARAMELVTLYSSAEWTWRR